MAKTPKSNTPPWFGINNRSLQTVPVAPSKSAAGVKALRALATVSLQGQSGVGPKIGPAKFPNGKKIKRIA